MNGENMHFLRSGAGRTLIRRNNEISSCKSGRTWFAAWDIYSCRARSRLCLLADSEDNWSRRGFGNDKFSCRTYLIVGNAQNHQSLAPSSRSSAPCVFIYAQSMTSRTLALLKTPRIMSLWTPTQEQTVGNHKRVLVATPQEPEKCNEFYRSDVVCFIWRASNRP